MGLDQYAYAKDENGETEHLAEWRKHNRLQGYMEKLWEDKGRPFDGEKDEGNPMGDFNCVPVELTLTDLEQLEAVIVEKDMPETGGFFFGSDSYSWEQDDGTPYKDGNYFYKETDLQFISDAYKAMAKGNKVFYSSWW